MLTGFKGPRRRPPPGRFYPITGRSDFRPLEWCASGAIRFTGGPARNRWVEPAGLPPAGGGAPRIPTAVVPDFAAARAAPVAVGVRILGRGRNRRGSAGRTPGRKGLNHFRRYRPGSRVIARVEISHSSSCRRARSSCIARDVGGPDDFPRGHFQLRSYRARRATGDAGRATASELARTKARHHGELEGIQLRRTLDHAHPPLTAKALVRAGPGWPRAQKSGEAPV